MSEQSESINELATALAKAQGKITGALKDSANPFFKSKYADLAACWDSCRLPLSENGLSVIQVPAADEQGVVLTTILAHASGQWIKSMLRMVPKDGSPQSVGSALTYARRYALAAMVGLAQVDDDGNAASGKGNDPRGEINAEPAEVKAWVSKIADMKSTDLDEFGHAAAAFKIHEELNRDQELYIAVADEIAKQGIFSKKNWKDLINLHKAKNGGPGARN
jgi:hypothetical protein